MHNVCVHVACAMPIFNHGQARNGGFFLHVDEHETHNSRQFSTDQSIVLPIGNCPPFKRLTITELDLESI